MNASSSLSRAVLPLEDQWLWDFWFVRDDARHHIYYLQADRGLGDPEQRHWNVSIGHAVSTDLHHWQPLGTCLAPSSEPAWDDCTTWTGSVVRHPQGHWCLFYTGTTRAERGLRQRIGLAESQDLHHWTRHSANPLLSVDERYYETLDAGLWHEQAWRDPCVIPDPSGLYYHMLFTARANRGPADARGVIGHAVSDDLYRWEVRPPVWAGSLYGEIEVPQAVAIEGIWYLLFSTSAHRFASDYRQRCGATPVTGTHYLMADRPTGPWRLPEDRFLAGDRMAGSIPESSCNQWMEAGSSWRFSIWMARAASSAPCRRRCPCAASPTAGCASTPAPMAFHRKRTTTSSGTRLPVVHPGRAPRCRTSFRAGRCSQEGAKTWLTITSARAISISRPRVQDVAELDATSPL